MIFPKKAIFGGFALSLCSISLTQAQATYCDGIHAKVAQWESDFNHEQVEEARVIGKFSMGGALPSRRLIVSSWREGHRIERLGGVLHKLMK